MSEHDDDTDKQHEPTPKKLEESRKKGDIPRSADLTTAAGYGGFLIAALVFGAAAVELSGAGLAAMIAQADPLARDIFSGGGAAALRPFAAEQARASAAWFAVPAVLALLAVIAQRGLVFAPSKLVPKLSRISPIETAKQKFGRNGFFEFFKSFAKLSIYSVILGFYLLAQLPRILGTLHLDPGPVAAEMARLTVGLLLLVLVVAAILGAVDWIWQSAEHVRKNRMSRKELMDELKQSEGDPAMKQQRRQKAVDIATNRMLTDVPTADVVIVNPTHYAVALKWNRLSGRAPICVAKGVDEVARRIREVAIEHAVPIHSDPPTARALHAGVEIGGEIRPESYRAVAAAIRFAERIRQKARGA